jgi:NADH-quinone oxidoreductase subunit C
MFSIALRKHYENSLKVMLTMEAILLQSIPAAINGIIIEEKGITINFDKKNLKIISKFLKYSSLLKFETLLDIWGTDNIKPINRRFKLYYMLLSLRKHQRIYLKCNIDIKHGLAKTTSITEEYPSANFLEREVWDLLGIFFIAHPDLRRIVTDYGFNGFPLRKDFPVTGFKEIRYDDEKAKIIYESVKFSQAFRNYTFESPWSKSDKE